MDLNKAYEKSVHAKKDNHRKTEEPLVYTIAQMAEKLTLSHQAVRNIIRAQNIPIIPGTKKIMVSKKNFERFFGV